MYSEVFIGASLQEFDQLGRAQCDGAEATPQRGDLRWLEGRRSQQLVLNEEFTHRPIEELAASAHAE